VVSKYTFHPITKDLMRDGVPVVMVEATSINLPDARTPGVTVTKLAETSGDRSYVKAAGATGADYVEGEDTRGRVAVAAAVDPSTPHPPADSHAPPPQRPKTRAVIVGDSDFPTNNVLRLPVGNRDFFMNAINWLSGSEELASIRPKPPEQRQLFLSTVQKNSLFFGTVIFIPLLILGAGTLVWWGRR